MERWGINQRGSRVKPVLRTDTEAGWSKFTSLRVLCRILISIAYFASVQVPPFWDFPL